MSTDEIGCVDPATDEELSLATVETLRSWRKYWQWKGSEKHHLDKTGQRVDRLRQVERLTAEIARRPPQERGPGRPVGFVPTEDTRAKISAARTREGTGEAPPSSTDGSISYQRRLAAFVASGGGCAACGAPYRTRYWKKDGKKKRYVKPGPDRILVVEVNSKEGIEICKFGDLTVALCRFCRSSAKDGGLAVLGLTQEVYE